MEGSSTLTLHYVDEVFVRIETSSGIEAELSEYFSFRIPNHFFNPKVKSGMWNGIIRLFNRKNKLIYKGLKTKIEEFALKRRYEIIDETGDVPNNVSAIDFKEFLKSLKLPEKIKPRDYQVFAALSAIRKKRTLLVCPTASGKSFIIYMILRYLNLRTLLIVPTVGLVTQMYNDFDEYSALDDSWNVDDRCSQLMAGKKKEDLNQITIATWQTLQNIKQDWFEDQGYEMIICDEAHFAKNKQLISIMEKNRDAEYRFGTTGTLDNKELHHFTLEGLFGEIKDIIQTIDLINRKDISELAIKCLVLQYPQEEREIMKGKKYQDEIDFLVSHEGRNQFITKLALSLPGNTLILFQFVEKHGKVLKELIEAANTTDKEILFVSGATDADIREETRTHVEKKGKDCIIIASFGVYSTGINIVNLHNVILAHPSKGEIRLLQSIGRGLRKGGVKDRCVLFDLSDDLSTGKKKNYSYVHFVERLRIYMKKKFSYKIKKIPITHGYNQNKTQKET